MSERAEAVAREEGRGEARADASAARADARRPTKVRAPLAALGGRAVIVAASVWLFVVALQLIKAGAGGLRPVLDWLSADGVAGHLGVGWLGSYAVLSGSPVAAS